MPVMHDAAAAIPVSRMGVPREERGHFGLDRLGKQAPLNTIRGFESGRRNPSGVTGAAIKQTLEQAGIGFLDGDGVRIKR